MPFNKTVTRSLVELIGLSPRCQQFADYWFSAWDDNKLPTPEKFPLGKIRKLQPFILALACKADGSAIVTAIGKKLSEAGGMNLLGTDWVNLTAEESRAERVRRGRAVARGAILRTTRAIQLEDNQVHHFETITVPLRRGENGVTIVTFVDWPSHEKVQVSADDMGRVADTAEFIPLVVNLREKPEAELVAKALKNDERVKIVSRAAIRFVLNFMGDTMANAPNSALDSVDYMIAMAIGSANVSHIDNDAALSRQYAGLIEPDWMRRGISRAAIARATMLPVETMRRRINKLIQKKILMERDDGIILSATNPLKFGARLDRMHAHAHLIDRMFRDMKARGITLG